MHSGINNYISQKEGRFIPLGNIERHYKYIDMFTKIFEDYPNIKNIAEIGFIHGHCANTLLTLKPDANMVSFEIDYADNNAAKYGKEYIDLNFSGRHTLIPGDSLVTVPNYVGETFDLIIVSGRCDLKYVTKSINNMKRLCNENTICILDEFDCNDPNKRKLNHRLHDPSDIYRTMLNENKLEHLYFDDLHSDKIDNENNGDCYGVAIYKYKY